MAEQFLTLMADLDEDTQAHMSEWYNALKEAGFTGAQTKGLPYHISLATFPLDKEQAAVETMRKAASKFSAMPVHISHIGVFAGGKVLFGAVEKSAELVSLRDACETGANGKYPWIPHVTVLIDEPDAVCAALSVLVRSFHPIVASIAKLHLCAFWPMREIASVELNGG
ncbi:MAG: 2'-5' RNA ligase family protein [Christensenellales bacterium]|jgi:2'-5' RNA ligase